MSSGNAQIVLPTGLARREVHRLGLPQFLGEKPPGWDLEKHPELKDGAAQWVESIRRDDEPTNGETHRN